MRNSKIHSTRIRAGRHFQITAPTGPLVTKRVSIPRDEACSIYKDKDKSDKISDFRTDSIIFTQNPCEPNATSISSDQKNIPLALTTNYNDIEHLSTAIREDSRLRDDHYRWVFLSTAITQFHSYCVKSCSTKCGNDCKTGNILQSIKSKPVDNLNKEEYRELCGRECGQRCANECNNLDEREKMATALFNLLRHNFVLGILTSPNILHQKLIALFPQGATEGCSTKIAANSNGTNN